MTCILCINADVNLNALFYSEDYYKQVDLKQLKKAGYWETPNYTVKTEAGCVIESGNNFWIRATYVTSFSLDYDYIVCEALNSFKIINTFDDNLFTC